MEQERIKVQIINKSKNPLPRYQTLASSGMDIQFDISSDICAYEEINGIHTRCIYIPPYSSRLLKTGIYVAIPEGYEIQVRPRSGLALKRKLTVLNTPGTIDADYRGEIGVILHNTSSSRAIIHEGERIAQLVLCKVPMVEWEEVEELPNTIRGTGGYGHTGNK